MRAAVILLLSLAALATASVAGAADRFVDPRGDVGAEGPDVTAVTLSHTDDDLVVAVTFASAPPLAFDEAEGYTDMLLVGIHTDDDLGRRDVEFWTGVHGVDLDRGIVVRGGGGRVGAAAVAVAGDVVTLRVPRALLGDPDAVAVVVAAGREGREEEAASAGGDEAPPVGAYRHTLDGGVPGWAWAALAAAGAVGVAAAVGSVTGERRRRRHGHGVPAS